MTPQPTLEHYRLLRRLRRLVLRSEEAAVIFLWGDDRRSFDWLRGELDRALRARSRCVVALAIPEAVGAVDVSGVAGAAYGRPQYPRPTPIPSKNQTALSDFGTDLSTSNALRSVHYT